MPMFLFKKNKPVTDPFSWMKMDIHCHLLPGIDDGSPDVETSVELIRHLSAAGINEFVCTPHVFGDMFRNTPRTVHAALDVLKAAIRTDFPQVKLSAAAEYMLDDYFMNLLRSGNSLLTIRGNYLLTELPFSIAPDNMAEMTFEIINAGYQPILAHPERYGYYHKNKNAYHRLKELGFLFQLNLLSLTGYYGPRVRSAARMLLKEGLIDYVGSDLHHFNHLNVLLADKSQRIFQKYLGDKFYNDFG